MSPTVRWIALAVVALGACYALFLQMFPSLLLPLGSAVAPIPGLAAYAGIWAVLGSFVALGLAMTIAHWLAADGRGERWRLRLEGVSDGAWMGVAAAFAAAAAMVTRAVVLRDMAITDDEASYRFAAQLLASGRLWVESPPMKLFFDHGFLLNDGRLQSMYFLGWPALAVPGIWLGIAGYTNAFYFGATVAAAFLIARRLYGTTCARVASTVLATSPFLVALAATELSHTTSLAALTWATWFLLRSREPDASWRSHAAFACLLSIAFFVRPITAAGFGVSMVGLWAWDRWRRRERRAAFAVAFAVPALALAGLFLAAQNAQHGSPWRSGYHHSVDYILENDHRFSTRAPDPTRATPGLQFQGLSAGLGRATYGYFWLGFDLTGWPIALLALAPALLAPASGFAWLLAAGGFSAVFFDLVVGIDSFGPVHYSEQALPFLLLLLAGVRWIGAVTRAADRPSDDPRRWVVVSALLALVVSAWVGYVPLRWHSLAQQARTIRAPFEAVAAAGLDRAVVFSPFPWVRSGCQAAPSRHLRFQRPVPGPDLDDDVLWVNHVDVASDRALMRHFPERSGYALLWGPGCKVVLIPIDSPEAEKIPPEQMRPMRSSS